jgi:hypothetical protein
MCCVFLCCVACFTAGLLPIGSRLNRSEDVLGMVEGWTETLLKLFLTEEN